MYRAGKGIVKMEDKNLALMDKILGAITGDGRGEWNDILMHDPMIADADNRFDAVLAKARDLIPDELCGELADAYSGGQMAVGEVGILFGLHVADTIRDVASRPADLSRYVMERMEGRA